MIKYQKLAEKFIEEMASKKWKISGNNPFSKPDAAYKLTLSYKINYLDFALWLDSQEKSGGKKIEKLEGIVFENKTKSEWPFANSLIALFNETRDKINELIKFHNENL